MKLLDDIYGKMSYETSKNIKNISLSACISTTIFNIASIYLTKQITLEPIYYGLSFELLSIFMAKIFSNESVENSKEISSIRNIYNDVIEEYNKLHKVFNFTNPVEMYAMFNYAYNDGYLSKNKIFNYGKTDRFGNCNVFDDLSVVHGINIINGTGVCRHISAMFRDILTKCNIENMLLVVYMKDFDEKVKPIIGNHIINVVKQNEICYFLDPTNLCMYELLDKSKLVSDECKLIICKLLNNLFNKKKCINIKHLMDLNNLDLKESCKIEANIYNICENNVDIFEKFYDENKDKYLEISDKMKVLK